MKKKKQKQLYVKHHIVNRCKGGSDTTDNLLYMKVQRERALHNIFGNYDLKQIKYILENINIRIILSDNSILDNWLILFSDKTKEEAIALLERVIRAKEAQRR